MFVIQNRFWSHLLLFMAVVLLLIGDSCVSGRGGRGGRGGGRAIGRSVSVGRSGYHSGRSHTSSYNQANTNGHAANYDQAKSQSQDSTSSQSNQHSLLGPQTDTTAKDGHALTSEKTQSGDGHNQKHHGPQKNTDTERNYEEGRSGSTLRRNRKGNKHATTTPFP